MDHLQKLYRESWKENLARVDAMARAKVNVEMALKALEDDPKLMLGWAIRDLKRALENLNRLNDDGNSES